MDTIQKSRHLTSFSFNLTIQCYKWVEMIVLTLNIIEKKKYERFIISFDEISNRKLLILKYCLCLKNFGQLIE